MSFSSIHIKAGNAGSIVHNARENYSLSVVFTDEQNELWNNVKEAYEIYRQELAKRTKAYTDRTNQKLQKNAITHLSAVVNLQRHHTLKDLEQLKNYLEKKLDTKVFQIAIHRDEGKLVNIETKKELYSGKTFFRNPKDNKLYFDKKFTQKIDMSKYEIVKNYHAHIEMMGLDSTGAGIKRNKLNKVFLSQLQTFTAQTLRMERGRKGVKLNRRDVNQFKEFGVEKQKIKSELHQTKLTVKELKKKIEALRKEMANAKQFSKEDYRALYKIKSITKKATLAEAVEEFIVFKSNIEQQMHLKDAELQDTKQQMHLKDAELQDTKQQLEQTKEDLDTIKTQRKEIIEALTPTYVKFQKEGKNPPRDFKQFICFVDEELNTYDKELKITKNKLSEQNRELLDLKTKISTLEAEKSSQNLNLNSLETNMKYDLDEQDKLRNYKGFHFWYFLREEYLKAKQYIKSLIAEINGLKQENTELKEQLSTTKQELEETKQELLDAKEMHTKEKLLAVKEEPKKEKSQEITIEECLSDSEMQQKEKSQGLNLSR